MREQINRIKNFDKFLNENKNNLPESINIDTELSQLRVLIKEKDNIKNKYRGNKELMDIINMKEFQDISNNEEIIEDEIKLKLWDTMIKYCENGDYEGAKQFVGKSYKDVVTSGKSLLFRAILVHQQQNKK